MGAVYLADDPRTGRRAAIKVLTLTTHGAIARFEREQRQLALLQHESIPRLLGTGTTEDGRPCFAMEYVRGAPITDFARAHALGATERVELFTLLCDAVRHAHAHLVVHRDIKPSNVLASKAPDGTCRVHLLDFGVSRPLTDGAYATTWGGGGEGPTGDGLRPMTPAYAAPEQTLPASAGREAATTAATDVFALGVLLYELLTGRRPLDGGAAPSLLSGLDMGRRLARSVDALVERAIDPDPDGRYASADALYADVRRVLNGHAPIAAGTGLSHRSLWFLARHRAGLVAAAVGVVTIVIAFAAADRRWRSALGASEDAGSELVGAMAEMLRSDSGEDAAGQAFLIRAGGALREQLGGQPAAEADLSLVAANELARQGHCDDALPLYGRAALLRTMTAPDHPVVVAALRGQARCAAGLVGLTAYASPSAAGVRRATRLAREALSLAVSRYGGESAVAASIEVDLALYRAYAGEHETTTDRLRHVRAVLGRLSRGAAAEAGRNREVRERADVSVPVFPVAESPQGVALIASRAETVEAASVMAQGDPVGAAEQAKRAVAPLLTRGQKTATDPPPVGWAEVVAFGLLTEARALRQTGEDDRAHAAAEQAAQTLAWRFGAKDPRSVRARATAAALRDPEPPRLTATLLSEIVADAEATGVPSTLAYALLQQGRTYSDAGDLAEAEAALGRVAAMRPEDAGPRMVALAFTELSELALGAGDVGWALDRSAAGLRTARTLVPAVGYSLDVLLAAATTRAAALVAAGREDDAVAVLEPVLQTVPPEARWPALAEAKERATEVLETAYARL
jgi:serine/threonine-protein kinase